MLWDIPLLLEKVVVLLGFLCVVVLASHPESCRKALGPPAGGVGVGGVTSSMLAKKVGKILRVSQ
jgi:hypothetical protein